MGVIRVVLAAWLLAVAAGCAAPAAVAPRAEAAEVVLEGTALFVQAVGTATSRRGRFFRPACGTRVPGPPWRRLSSWGATRGVALDRERDGHRRCSTRGRNLSHRGIGLGGQLTRRCWSRRGSSTTSGWRRHRRDIRTLLVIRTTTPSPCFWEEREVGRRTGYRRPIIKPSPRSSGARGVTDRAGNPTLSNS